MELFVCNGCGTELTNPLTRVALPAHAHQSYGNGVAMGNMMQAGTCAVDPRPTGPPWRLWHEVTPEEAEARGIFAPVYSVCFGPTGEIAVTPGDTRNTVLIPGPTGHGCCGQCGDGLNLSCTGCGRMVGTRVDDCSVWQVVWLRQEAVRSLPVGPAEPPVDWPTLLRDREGIPPVDPCGHWDPRWEAEIGVALAHLLVASGGSPVAVQDGLVAECFRRSLDAQLPPGPPAKSLALAGPGLPDPGADILLAPRHPQTGEAWPCAGATTVSLGLDVWIPLTRPAERPLPAVPGELPEALPAQLPWRRFEPDGHLFQYTLARLPAVREPWLRAIYDRVGGTPVPRLFEW